MADSPRPQGLPNGMLEAIEFSIRYPRTFQNLSSQVEESLKERDSFTKSNEYKLLLSSRLEAFRQGEKFEVGQMVFWKPGLKNKNRPRYGEPCVVAEVPDVPLSDPITDAGSPYFNEPLDLLIGVLDEDRELTLYYVDSRRFTATAADVTAQVLVRESEDHG